MVRGAIELKRENGKLKAEGCKRKCENGNVKTEM